ncbi:hypothetical protein [Acetobacter estunensis]|uniref:hypothetical protein n=1 Tax=Acetobacter estunensis TaxID=104097 RepID=UPI001C2D1357|nr:hypothetical protein [Acetobacter estunensis]MBV1836480.1 hypothetical protein [Acetobacter estunensis]
MTFPVRLFAIFALAAAPVAAHAEGVWSAQGCGSEPSMPSLDVSSVERYNASIDKATTYEKAARTYNACVSREATKQQTAISNEAKVKMGHIQEGSSAVQKRIGANFTKIASQLKAADAKFGKKH